MWKTETEQSANWRIQQREHHSLTYMVKKSEGKKEKKRRGRKGRGGREGKKKEREREKKKQKSKDKQMYVKKIYIYSGIAIPSKEL